MLYIKPDDNPKFKRLVIYNVKILLIFSARIAETTNIHRMDSNVYTEYAVKE